MLLPEIFPISKDIQDEIELYKLAKSTNGFQPENSYIIPMNQYQSRLIKAIFDVRTSFTDSLFYDVSAFNMGMSFNLTYKSIAI